MVESIDRQIDSVASTVERHRAQFSSLANKHYFNYGGQGPMADSAIVAMAEAQQKIQRDGPFAGAVYEWLQAESQLIRGAIAVTLGTSPDTITLTENVTVGCNIPLWGLPWQPGDHILMGDCEHPGVVAAVRELSRRYGVTVSTCALSSLLAGADPVTVISQGLRPETRLVIVSHILWNTGQVLPLKAIAELCHAHAPHTRLLVDAAQSVGTLPLDPPGSQLPETGVDFYAFTGHKWLCGPAGLGALYIRPDRLDETAPTFIGWRGVKVDEQANPTGWETDARRYEVATSDYGLWGGLRQSMAVQATWGDSQARYERICLLSARLWQGLRDLPQVECLLRDAPPPSGLVSFQIRGREGVSASQSHRHLVQQLEAEKIYLRTLLSPSCVRACVHYFTLESEVDFLLERVADILGAAGE
ncbi:MAG: aminotransferase class V-fold PLP-dependent enzyme [Cyanobacteria bacterium J06627_32]